MGIPSPRVLLWLLHQCQHGSQVFLRGLLEIFGRREFERQMESRRLEETDPAEWEPLRRGWCLGSEAFRAKLLEEMGPKLGEHHSGPLRQENDQAKTERLVAEEIRRLKRDEAQLRQSPKHHPAKLALAVRLRRETTLTVRVIAQRPHMGHWKSLSNKLCLYRKIEAKREK